MPYRAVVFNGNMRPRDTTSVDSALYFFNNGKLIRDSVVHFVKLSPSPNFIRTGYDAQRYTYNGTSISAVTDNWAFGIGQIKANVVILISQNTANTITIEKQRTPFSTGLTSKQQYKITYDNNHNPLFGLVVPGAGFGVFNLVYYRYYFPNNVVEIEKIFDSESSTSPWHDKFNYTYRSDGFPLTAIHLDLVNPNAPYNDKGLFFYK